MIRGFHGVVLGQCLTHSFQPRDFQSGLDAGDEIFLNYGYCGEDQGDEVLGKDEERPGQPDAEPAWTASIPKTPDFEAAASIATLMFRRLEKRQNSQQTTIGRFSWRKI